MPFDESGNRARLDALRRRGVDTWGPDRVYVSPEVDLGAIEPGAVLRHATLAGSATRIAKGTKVGTSGHAEVADCQVGQDVELGAGLYRGATLLEGVKVRGFAEIRPATLLEEQVEAAHCVALKNATFTSCCVAGSLINFCDLFLSGGTSRSDHTEIGSGAIHFNFDPRGDKWGSLIGDARGVLLRSEPIFIGGQCGLVGPVQVGFGSVTAAGSVIRADVGENVVTSGKAGSIEISGFDRRIYGRLTNRFLVTAKLIGTLWALDAWYGAVRLPYATASERPIYEAARGRIAEQRSERIKRLAKIVEKLPASLAATSSRSDRLSLALTEEHRSLISTWDTLKAALRDRVDLGPPPQAFLDAYAESRSAGRGHVQAVRRADAAADETTQWLASMVRTFCDRASSILGSVRQDRSTG